MTKKAKELQSTETKLIKHDREPSFKEIAKLKGSQDAQLKSKRESSSRNRMSGNDIT